MSLYNLLKLVMVAADVAIQLHVKNEQSKKVFTTYKAVADAVVEELAHTNPDGTPATEPYKEPTK